MRFHIILSPVSSSLNSRILSGSTYMFLLLTVTVLCCFVPFGYKPPAKAGTSASPLKRTQDIITDLGSKNDTPFAKWSLCIANFGLSRLCAMPASWAGQLRFGKSQSSIIFGVFSLTWVTNCGGCVWLAPALQHGVMCGIPSFVPPAGKWQNLPNVYA